MSEHLIHITTCVVCGSRPKPFRIEAGGFEPIPAIGPIPKRAEEFGKRLFAHLYSEGQKEQAQLQTGEGPPKVADLQEAAVFMMNHAAHLSAVRAINQTAEWAQRFALLAAFHSTDPALIAAREATRYALQQATLDRNPDASDNDIEMTARVILQTFDGTSTEVRIIQELKQILREFRERMMHPPAPEGMMPAHPLIETARGSVLPLGGTAANSR